MNVVEVWKSVVGSDIVMRHIALGTKSANWREGGLLGPCVLYILKQSLKVESSDLVDGREDCIRCGGSIET